MWKRRTNKPATNHPRTTVTSLAMNLCLHPNPLSSSNGAETREEVEKEMLGHFQWKTIFSFIFYSKVEQFYYIGELDDDPRACAG